MPFSRPLLIVLLASGLVHTINTQFDNEFEQFKSTFCKRYVSPEAEREARQAFSDNWWQILQHNAAYQRGEVTDVWGPNEFLDMTFEQFQSHFLGALPTQMELALTAQGATSEVREKPSEALPDEVDWVAAGAVTPVRNQGGCGSCWAFATVGSLEGAYAARSGELLTLSEQHLVDCSKQNSACNGGWMHRALAYVKENGGIALGRDYQYQGKEGTCVRHAPDKLFARLQNSGWVWVNRGDTKALQMAVATVGPVSVALHVVTSFSKTSGGIYSEANCNPSRPNHAVIIVGYGTDRKSGLPYWKVRNSWGETWGNGGYIKVLRGANVCGIEDFAVYPDLHPSTPVSPLNQLNNVTNVIVDRLNELSQSMDRKLVLLTNVHSKLHDTMKATKTKLEQLVHHFTGSVTKASELTRTLSDNIWANMQCTKEIISRIAIDSASTDADFAETITEMDDLSSRMIASSARQLEDLRKHVSDEIGRHNAVLSSVENTAKEVSRRLGDVLESPSAFSTEVGNIEQGVEEALEALRDSSQVLSGPVKSVLASTVGVLRSTVEDIQQKRQKVDEIITQILFRNDRLMLLAAFNQVFRRFNLLRQTRPANDNAGDVEKTSWAVKVIHGNRHGMSMGEVLFNLDLMIKGQSRSTQMRSLLAWYMEASRLLAEQDGGASQQLLMGVIKRDLITVQQLGYKLLQEAYLILGFDELAHQTVISGLSAKATQSRTFDQYLAIADGRLRLGSFDPSVSPAQNIVSVSIQVDGRAIKGCRLCSGCETAQDVSVMSMQCEITPSVNELKVDLSRNGNRLYPNTASERNGLPVKLKHFPSKVAFMAMQFFVKSKETHLVCGIHLRHLNTSTVLLRIDIDVCDIRTMKLLGNSQVDESFERGLIEARDCDGKPIANFGSRLDQSPFVRRADDVATSWNRVDLPGVTSMIYSAGLCGEANSRNRRRTILRLVMSAAMVEETNPDV